MTGMHVPKPPATPPPSYILGSTSSWKSSEMDSEWWDANGRVKSVKEEMEEPWQEDGQQSHFAGSSADAASFTLRQSLPKDETKEEIQDELKEEMKSEPKEEMKEEDDSDSSSEEETGRWVAALRPPQPKKMPRPVSGTEVATPKWSGPTAPSTKRARSTSPSRVDSRAKKLVVRPSSKAVPRAPSKPSIRPPAPPVPTLPEKPAYETSTGLRPQPPPMSMYDENERSPLPGPPPVQDPVPVGAPTALALPNSGAMVPWAPQGDSQILVDVDQEGLAIGEMLQDSGFIEAMQVIQGRLADVLKATGQSNGGPVRVNVHVDLGGGAPAPLPMLLGNMGLPALGYDGRPRWDLPNSVGHERVVDVSEVRFCQRSMKRRFQDGRSLEELIRGLISGRIDPLTAEFLKLTCVEKEDEYKRYALFSKDNRRLYCLKEYQKRCSFKPVPMRVKVLPWRDVMEACMFRRNYDTETDGHEIILR